MLEKTKINVHKIEETSLKYITQISITGKHDIIYVDNNKIITKSQSNSGMKLIRNYCHPSLCFSDPITKIYWNDIGSNNIKLGYWNIPTTQS